MAGELALAQDDIENRSRALSGAEVLSRLGMILDCMRTAMKKGEDYGIIPGCKKPSLWKPGAEKIALMFRLSAEEPVVESLGDVTISDEIRYRVRMDIRDAHGRLIAFGLGECSSSEEKYAWRKAVCDQEWNETPENMRREKWSGGDHPYKMKQVRQNPASQANTILKMAKKRSYVDAMLTATAASAIFGQDMPEEDADGHSSAAPVQPQKASSENAPQSSGTITEPQRKRFYAIYKNAGLSDEAVKGYLKQKYGLAHSKDIPRNVYNELCAWAERGGIEEPPPDEPGSNG